MASQSLPLNTHYGTGRESASQPSRVCCNYHAKLYQAADISITEGICSRRFDSWTLQEAYQYMSAPPRAQDMITSSGAVAIGTDTDVSILKLLRDCCSHHGALYHAFYILNGEGKCPREFDNVHPIAIHLARPMNIVQAWETMERHHYGALQAEIDRIRHRRNLLRDQLIEVFDYLPTLLLQRQPPQVTTPKVKALASRFSAFSELDIKVVTMEVQGRQFGNRPSDTFPPPKLSEAADFQREDLAGNKSVKIVWDFLVMSALVWFQWYRASMAMVTRWMAENQYGCILMTA
ncbi:hypothetical protein CAC42_715 [Sphaceloma murrayae]|uniref:Uncharacterized protein n=1 Tax=Sphaceloma murrayae TaxID=2082308 RepID=A0A2K1QJY9_9PEZI|nr:hypothetical protein CAC42_715 [Sphaceloma murrayae]